MTDEKDVSVKVGDLINKRFLVKRVLGKGSFGVVFLGKDLMECGKRVAIKVERKTGLEFLHDFSQLQIENMVLTHLGGGKWNPVTRATGGFPRVYYFGVHGEAEHVLVMELLGPSLDSLFISCQRKFCMKTILILTDQLLYRLSYLHECGYLHRDLKPENILMGAIGKSKDVVHLIDFGLSMSYWSNRNTKEHIKQNLRRTEGGRGVGTIRYMSCWCQNMQQGSRRDDMESLVYILAYFLRGSLPWQNVIATTTRQKNAKILAMKMSTTPEELFEGFPPVFAEFFKCVKQLKFEDAPDYKLYQNMFRELGKSYQIWYLRGEQFEWTIVDNDNDDAEQQENDNSAIKPAPETVKKCEDSEPRKALTSNTQIED